MFLDNSSTTKHIESKQILYLNRVYHNEVNSLKNDSELKSMKYLVN